MGNYQSGGDDLIKKYAETKIFKSKSEFARFLYNLDPSRSVDAWRLKVLRWEKRGGKIKQQDTVAKNMNVYYDKSNDCYISVMDDSKELISVDGDTHRAIKRAYSKDGGNLKAHEIARKFSLPENWVVSYIRSNDWTHGMDIFTDEEISVKSLGSLVEDAISEKRKNVLEEANRKYWRQIERDANKYRLFDELILKEFRELVEEPMDIPALVNLPESDSPYALVVSPTDLHYGKGAWEDECGQTYNLKEARNRLMNQTSNLVSRLPATPEKIILATGSDWFHVDNELGSTTKGTPQDMAATPAQILRDGCMLAREHIELLAQVAPVEVIFMRGNHDRHTSLSLMMYLSAVYENNPQVTVSTGLELRQYVKWGNNLLGFTHGDGVRSSNLPALMATESREDWGDTEHHTWFHGHLHHMKQTEKDGCMVVQLPSLAGHDRWHYRKGFTLNRAGLSGHLIDYELGVIGTLFAPVV